MANWNPAAILTLNNHSHTAVYTDTINCLTDYYYTGKGY